jgi:pyridinium-3,5-biscarboxylic acid mononucleotide synthase
MLMDEAALVRLLEAVRSGACTADEAVASLRRLPFVDLGFAKVDHHRGLRQGLPEAVYAQGKTAPECAAIVEELLAGIDAAQPGDREAGEGPPVILTRADPVQVEACLAAHPGGAVTPTGAPTGTDHRPGPLATVVWRPRTPRGAGTLVLTAGTSDLPVARECAATLEALGVGVQVAADCGVAGIHRLLAMADELADADAVVVVAGMEGALASVVGGITPAPVVAVPTSTGYGAGLEGVTALLGMLASCAAGVVVVGIDNGFGAACAVARLLP